MALERYQRLRDFGKTPEPGPKVARSGRKLKFFVQRHAASRLHYDLRLELEGVLKSWAVPKGPSLDPRDKRLAMHVEDHPMAYGTFEGVIPKGEYGAGTVLLWDQGAWLPEGDPDTAYAKGHLAFELRGEKLHGRFTLVRIRGQGGKGDPWLLIKRADDQVSRADITAERPESVARSTRRPKNTRDLPLFVPPELCTPAEAPPHGEGWLHEIKLDGYRMQARIQDGKALLSSRTGHDWTSRFRTLARAMAALPVKQALLDGEIVRLDAGGVSRFQALVNSIGTRDEAKLHFFAFDLLHLDGEDLRPLPLTARKVRLAALLEANDRVRYVDHTDDPGIFASGCAAGLEGVVSKRAASTYRSARTRDWLKVKCQKSEELVIVGWTEPKGSRSAFGALLVAAREDGALRYAGKVGTGFSEASLADLAARLERIARDTAPLPKPPRLRGARWVDPVLVAEVRFTEWTDDGILRHPVFLGLREDKPAREVAMDAPVLEYHLTHPERVVFPAVGLTKGDLAAYYAAVADRMLPGIVGRPLSLVRCPKGASEACFFHRHPSPAFGKSVKHVTVGDETYIYIEDAEGLLALAQAGVIEIHPWGSRVDAVEKPDRIVMDLDPDPAVNWEDVVSTAVAIRDLLDGLGLKSFARVTGGKGVHVVAPFARKHGWDVVKPFCRGIAELMERADPERFTTNARKTARKGRIFIDYLRNGLGATAIASWSARAKPDAPVAAPVSWEELASLGRSDVFHVADVLAARPDDAWEDFEAVKQSLTMRAIRAV